MTSSKKTDASRSDGKQDTPAWADGLRQLYDSVVDEPLPDTFMDLLAQLDDADDEDAPSDKTGGQ